MLIVIAVMFGSLVMAAALPEAFGSRGLVFAVTYVAVQIGRTLFCIWALRGHELHRNFVRVAIWFGVSSIPWIAGALADGDWRETFWALALGLELVGGLVGFYVPGLGSTRTSEWTISTAHLVERCQLFVIIALGESIIITGGTFSNGEFTGDRTAAFVVAFVGSVALWWIHFLNSSRVAVTLRSNINAGQFARTLSYTVVVVIFGIIVSAVGDDLVIAHPTGHPETSWLLVIFGGPALFVAGQALVQFTLVGEVSRSCIVGLIAIGILAPAMASAAALTATIAATAVLIGIAAFDTVTQWDVVQRQKSASVETAEGTGSPAS